MFRLKCILADQKLREGLKLEVQIKEETYYAEERLKPNQFSTFEEDLNNYENFEELSTSFDPTFQNSDTDDLDDSKPLIELVSYEENKFQCDQCDIKFAVKASYRRHIARKHPDQQLKCDLCNKVYDSTKTLKQHKQKCQGNQCDICKKNFDSGEDLKSHVLEHKGDDGYVCPECGKSFTAIRFLKKHVAVGYFCEYRKYVLISEAFFNCFYVFLAT